MSSDVSSALRSIIDRQLARPIDGPAARIEKRHKDASATQVVLCDCSGSMDDLVGKSDMTKFRHLEIALADVVSGYPKLRLVAFASRARVIHAVSELPQPAGGTNLTAALELVAPWLPRQTIVISDGMPDCELSALTVADRMTGTIDTIYCGADGHPAIEFLRRLATKGGGRSVTWDGRNEISGTIRGLLTA